MSLSEVTVSRLHVPRYQSVLLLPLLHMPECFRSCRHSKLTSSSCTSSDAQGVSATVGMLRTLQRHWEKRRLGGLSLGNSSRTISLPIGPVCDRAPIPQSYTMRAAHNLTFSLYMVTDRWVIRSYTSAMTRRSSFLVTRRQTCNEMLRVSRSSATRVRIPTC